MEGRPEKPPATAKTDRSRTWSPIAIAGLGELFSEVLMIPNGIFEREKCEVGETGSHEVFIVRNGPRIELVIS
jgi:hypothetical protein